MGYGSRVTNHEGEAVMPTYTEAIEAAARALLIAVADADNDVDATAA